MYSKKKKYITKASSSHGHDIWVNFKANKLALIAAVMLILITILAVSCDLFIDYNTQVVGMDPRARLQGPSAEHWFGTDSAGRDLFARVLYGTRYSLVFGIGCTFFSMFIGCILGASAAYYGGVYDSVLMRILDALMCIPYMLLLLMIVAVMGRGL